MSMFKTIHLMIQIKITLNVHIQKTIDDYFSAAVNITSTSTCGRARSACKAARAGA